MANLWNGNKREEYKSYFNLLYCWQCDVDGIFVRRNLVSYLKVDLQTVHVVLHNTREELDADDGKRHWKVEKPSFFKKAAVLAINTWKYRPMFRRGLDELVGNPDLATQQDTLEETSVRAENAANLKFAIDVGLAFLKGWSVKCPDGSVKTIENLPKYPSRHFMIELCERLFEEQLTPQGLALIYELLTYRCNPHMQGCCDKELDGQCEEFLL